LLQKPHTTMDAKLKKKPLVNAMKTHEKNNSNNRNGV
jgi:hypothetical protein